MIDIYEFIENKLVTEINFYELEIDENNSEVYIELVNSKDINLINEFLSDEFSSDSYELIFKSEYNFIIRFKDKIKYIDESEYIENLKDELDSYESMYSNIFNEILSENDYNELEL